MLFHVKITHGKGDIAYGLDYSEQQLEQRVLVPYSSGSNLVVGGTLVQIGSVGRVQVFASEVPFQSFLPRIRAHREASSLIGFGPDESYLNYVANEVTEQFITAPPGAGPKPVNAPASSRQRMAFVSHTESDQGTANRLTDLLLAALHLDDSEVRCTSVPGHQLPFGTSIAVQLKNDISVSAVVLAILTPHSLRSNWVLFELGATWGLGKMVVPILGPGVDFDDLPGPLGAFPAVSVDRTDARNRMKDAIKQIASALEVQERTGGRSEAKLTDFLAALKDWRPAPHALQITQGEDEGVTGDLARALVTADAEIRKSPTRGVQIEPAQLVYAHWRTDQMIGFDIPIVVRNTWVYPITVDRISATYQVSGWVEREIPDKLERYVIPGREAHQFNRPIEWTPATDQRRQLGLDPDTMTSVEFTVATKLLCLSDGEDVEVPGTIRLTAIVNPKRPSP